MKDYIGETIKKLPFYMTFTKLVFDLKNCKVITFEKKKQINKKS